MKPNGSVQAASQSEHRSPLKALSSVSNSNKGILATLIQNSENVTARPGLDGVRKRKRKPQAMNLSMTKIAECVANDLYCIRSHPTCDRDNGEDQTSNSSADMDAENVDPRARRKFKKSAPDEAGPDSASEDSNQKQVNDTSEIKPLNKRICTQPTKHLGAFLENVLPAQPSPEPTSSLSFPRLNLTRNPSTTASIQAPNMSNVLAKKEHLNKVLDAMIKLKSSSLSSSPSPSPSSPSLSKSQVTATNEAKKKLHISLPKIKTSFKSLSLIDLSAKNLTLEQPASSDKTLAIGTASPLVSENSAKSGEIDSQETTARKAEFDYLLKLSYLNACGALDNTRYNSLIENSTTLTDSSTAITENATPVQCQSPVATKLASHIIEQLDVTLRSTASQSPFYSLSLETNASREVIFVFIKFLSCAPPPHSSASVERQLVKLIKTKPDAASSSSMIKDTHMSRLVFEQLRTHVLQKFDLSKDNLTLVTVADDLMDTLCVSTLQLYVNDLLNRHTLVMPSMRVDSTLDAQLTAWNFNNGQVSLRAYFATYQQLLQHLRGAVESMASASFDTVNFQFRVESLSDYLPVTLSVYANYPRILTALEQSADKQLPGHAELCDMLNSIDFYFATCLFCDLFKFLIGYMRHARPPSCTLNKSTFAWNLPGSLLFNLQNVQLTEYKQPNEIKFNSPFKGLKASLEAEEQRLSKLTDVKNSIETTLTNVLDLNSPGFKAVQTKFVHCLNCDNTQRDEVLDIYRTLVEMFNISLNSIVLNPHTRRLNLTCEVSDSRLEQLLHFYNLQPLISLAAFKSQYRSFFEAFFYKHSDEIKPLVYDCAYAAEFKLLSSSSQGDQSQSMLGKLVSLFYENIKTNVFREVNALAGKFLSLQPLVDSNLLLTSHGENKQGWSAVAFESKLRLLNAVKSQLLVDTDDRALSIDLADLSIVEV